MASSAATSSVKVANPLARALPSAHATGGDLAIWEQVRAALRAESGERNFETWLAPLAFLGCDEGEVHVAAPSAFLADWVANHFAERLRHHWAQRRAGVRQVTVSVRSDPAHAAPSGTPVAAPRPLAAVPAPAMAVPGLSLPIESRYTFQSFVVGKSNELAYNAAQAVAEPGAPGFNPLFLHGTTGLGKTHLMHAIGNAYLARQPDARVVYMSAEKFMVEFLAALRAKEAISFKQKLRSVDLLMIDDVQFIAGKESTQEEFFHTMNEIISAGKRLVITADRSPQNLEGIEQRILSRMAWGLVADINPADYELRLNILHAKVEAMPQQVAVPDDVIEFLARKITANVRELEGALNRVVAYAALVNAPVTQEFARERLADLLRAHERKLTIDDIQRKVAEHYKLKMADLLSARRAREVARPRQVAMYLAKKLTPRSLPEIGRRFGGRDHTTVMHAVKRIEELRAVDRELDGDVMMLTRLLDG
ncbi:chromosomal replication initiator protein DnaA [Polymorphobacter multimanifer]|uniref:Chromosomal replication initiator protein DnaA n=1 Tax=Polymorphobacter multimanifer TaxID=1070431 RepID=A0A841LBH4_9SPHN|nr:chromosomal replication initiator protein [Polymorphobacter multimanifer]GGI75812.1 chromosomal replication initiator protein DnaA [Polymorphobacter multimanifer]